MFIVSAQQQPRQLCPCSRGRTSGVATSAQRVLGDSTSVEERPSWSAHINVRIVSALVIVLKQCGLGPVIILPGTSVSPLCSEGAAGTFHTAQESTAPTAQSRGSEGYGTLAVSICLPCLPGFGAGVDSKLCRHGLLWLLLCPPGPEG